MKKFFVLIAVISSLLLITANVYAVENQQEAEARIAEISKN